MLDACFTDDVSAILTPMGQLHGRRELLTTLKAFRMPWPVMQHMGAPVSIDVEGDTASMPLGRIAPGQPDAADGEPSYVAHYLIEARRDPAHGWRIARMDYHPK